MILRIFFQNRLVNQPNIWGKHDSQFVVLSNQVQTKNFQVACLLGALGRSQDGCQAVGQGKGRQNRGSCCPIQMVKIQKKKNFGGGGAGAVNYFAEFSLNSRFLFSSVIFFQDVWAKSSGLVFFLLFQMTSPAEENKDFCSMLILRKSLCLLLL